MKIFDKNISVNHCGHNHSLKPFCDETPYKCDGCQETGWGLRFRCSEGCNYDLHKDCALYSETKSDLPFYKNSIFRFLLVPFVGVNCKACGKTILGFAYTCFEKEMNLHPCCANLPSVLEGEGVKLHLREYVLSKCVRCCNRNLWGQSRGWSYTSSCKNYHIHVSCMKDVVKNEIEEKWQKYFCKRDSSSNNIRSSGVNVRDIVTFEGEGLSRWRKISKSRSWKIASIVLNLVISIVMGNPFGAVNIFVSLLS